MLASVSPGPAIIQSLVRIWFITRLAPLEMTLLPNLAASPMPNLAASPTLGSRGSAGGA